MALINKLRNKAGTLIVGAVGFAIVSFVLVKIVYHDEVATSLNHQ